MKNYEKHNRRHFAAAFVCILIGTFFAVVLQFFKGDVLDYAVAGELEKTFRSAVLLILFILGEVGFCYLVARFSARFVVGCTRELKQDIFESILRRSFVAYKAHPQGEYLAKYTSDADTIQNRRFQLIPTFWEILLKILFVGIALFVLDWRIAVITIALLTTPLYIPKLIEKPLQNAQSAQLQAVENCLAGITDWLSGFEIIKNYSIERRILDRFRPVNNAAMDAQLRNDRLGAVSQLITTLISYLSYYIVLACAAWLVLRGDFSAGDFFIAIGMIDQLSWPLISLANIIRQLIAVKPVCAEMEAFLKAADADRTMTNVVELKREIRFRGVTFSYDGQRNILENFELTIGKGKRYLLKGPSGCGKTTAVNLLLRYFDADSGSIEIDGLPIERCGSTYGLMTVVRQEATLFRDTLRSNLTMYREIPEERLLGVLRSVGLERFADREALDQPVAEGGSNFSGGEKKRICLARALLRDTEVLILDEPLANLDAATAERIEDLLLSIRDRTLIVVSHQFTDSKPSSFDEVVDLA